MDRVASMSNNDIIAHILRYKTSYYQILFVEKTANESQIKSNYRKLAIRCHPDKNSENRNAEEAFKLLSTAHSVLTDETKRRVYDRGGTTGVQRHESGGGGGGGGFRGGNTYYYQQGGPHGGGQYYYYQAGGMGAGSIFEELFGGLFQQPHPQQRQRAQQQQQRAGAYARGPQARHGVHVEQVDLGGSLLMFLPFLLFLLLALLLQSNLFDLSSPFPNSHPSNTHFNFQHATTGQQFRAQMKKSGFLLSLTPSPHEGLNIQRTTSLHGLRTTYYINQRWEDMLRHSKQKQELLARTEEAVLEAQRDYLAHRCEAESQQQRARKKKAVAPEVCGEYHRYRKALAS